MDAHGSPFLEVPESEWVAANMLAFAIRGRHSVGAEHVVISRRLVAKRLDVTRAELAILGFVRSVEAKLDADGGPQ